VFLRLIGIFSRSPEEPHRKAIMPDFCLIQACLDGSVGSMVHVTADPTLTETMYFVSITVLSSVYF